jgi:hypothetical protein
LFISDKGAIPGEIQGTESLVVELEAKCCRMPLP